MWPLFLGIHVIGLTGYNLMLRKSLVAKVDRWTLATIMQTGVALPLLVFAAIVRPHLHGYSAALIVQMVVTAGLVIALHTTNVMALQHLEASVYSILFNLRILFTTVFGILFLNETVIPLQILGGVCIFMAVFALRKHDRKHLTIIGIQWGLIAALTISVLNLSEKSLLNHVSYLSYAVPTLLLSSLVMWAVLLIRGTRLPKSYLFKRSTIALMSLRALSAHGALLALTFGATLSIYTYVSSLSVVLTVIFGILLLGEKQQLRQKIVATVVAFTGLTIILVANLSK